MSCVVTKRAHRLLDIRKRSTGVGPGVVEVVRWCRDCGGLVVDIDVDGRTHPGAGMRMQFPALARTAAEQTKR